MKHTGIPVITNPLEISNRLKLALIEYLEAQNHIADEHVVQERRELLMASRVLSQEPFIETTPMYELGRPFADLGLPTPVGETLTEMTRWPKPYQVFAQPYAHQAHALQEFFSRGKDLVVSTGTGSGKTETFLWPILGTLLMEGQDRPQSYHLPGVRALMLYPTNALVGDQISRLRRLIGADPLRTLFHDRYARVPTFGMYTSRTPYPGQPSEANDKRRLRPVVDRYIDIERAATAAELKRQLVAQGRWPARDMERFARSGFQFDPDASEMYTRAEMQHRAPDILVTNYSMLEYMLIRPIERTIFQQTRAWLQADPENHLIFVLDEAHLYRGSSGAEVALLIRRLTARLGVGAERLRFILTSASLGSEGDATGFAMDLTGKPRDAFSVVTAQVQQPSNPEPGSIQDARALAAIGSELNQQVSAGERLSVETVHTWMDALGCPSPEALSGVPAEEMAAALAGFPPLQFVRELTSSQALPFRDLARETFPIADDETGEAALASLLTLGAMAQDDNRPLLPTRAHMMFRGTPAVYACIDPACDARRHLPGKGLSLGRLYTEPRVHCSCSGRGRTYELYSHSDCGGLFLKAYRRANSEPAFYWHDHESNDQIPSEDLIEVYLMVSDIHPANESLRKLVRPVYLQISTGREAANPGPDTVRLYEVRPPEKNNRARRSIGVPFQICPHCGVRNARTQVRSLRTQGEGPFATLVRHQFFAQPSDPASPDRPNAGRKTLIFSDGRQRAARLARDLPRVSEFETFRGVLLLAIQRLSALKSNRLSLRPDELYTAVVATCSELRIELFDNADESDTRFRQDIQRFEKSFDGDLIDAVEEPFTPPVAFYRALFGQLCDPVGSLSKSCIVLFRPTARLTKRIRGHATDDVVLAGAALITHLLKEGMVDLGQTDAYHRKLAWPHWDPPALKNVLSDLGTKLPRYTTLMKQLVDSDLLIDDMIDLSKITVELALDCDWLLCEDCGHLQEPSFRTVCLQCGGGQLTQILGGDPRFQSRKGFWQRPARQALQTGKVLSISVEEHSAQLSYRDHDRMYATTEEHELRFLDIPIHGRRPIDILSCTTTMEVGIDIGALSAVGLRNIPPRRDNYQQRAGRAGRRGNAISTVMAFGMDGPHDSHYFDQPREMISAPLQTPRIHADNSRLAKRHLNAWLIQTYFHETIERVGTPATPPGVFDALGSVSSFFGREKPFSFETFRGWARRAVIQRPQELQWLPDSSSDALECAVEELISTLQRLSETKYRDVGKADRLLDLLFDNGLLPSYAFPTDVVPLTLFGDDRIEEQPQLSKAQALSEYAPGRTVVVNKKTYRVGGIYDPHSHDRAICSLLNDAQIYAYCPNCTYVDTTAAHMKRDTCPVCNDVLSHMSLIDPPGFSPEKARALQGHDLQQEYTVAGRAQLPIPQAADDEWHWREHPDGHFRYTYAKDQRLLVANTGVDGAGFAICQDCGAAFPSGRIPDKHQTPFLNRQHRSVPCNGALRKGIALGTSILTDVLLIRFSLDHPMKGKPTMALTDALLSVSEALSLAASRVLDIDQSELNAGFRFVPSKQGAQVVDIYLYDTASGGAGYAYDAGERLASVFANAQDVLASCPADCDRSCNGCLRHYGNQFDHIHLDRFLGAGLLDYIVGRTVPTIERRRETRLLESLRDYLTLEDGVASSLTLHGLMVAPAGSSHSLQVRVHSALMERPSDDRSVVWLDDFILDRNLPSSAAFISGPRQ